MSQDRRVREVMQELRSLVEERRIVLVAFQQERPRTRLYVEAGPKIFRHTSDQK